MSTAKNKALAEETKAAGVAKAALPAASSKGGSSPAAKTVTTAVKSYSQKPGGYLIDNNGILNEVSEWAAKSLLLMVEPEMMTGDGDKSLPVWRTDVGGDRFTAQSTGNSYVNSCVFDAVKECMQSLGIGTLTPGDKSFFRDHPRVNSDGVNKANVLAVAHGLAVPWGVGITRVFVPKMSTLGDQHKEFATALGINPLALQNYNTSNEEFISAMEFDPHGEEAKMVRSAFRFEFVDAPSRPCVIMMASTSATKKTGGTTVKGAWSSTTSGIGHADFIGPRDRISSDWKIAFQLGPLPEYAVVDGKSINRYSDVRAAFDADELQDTAYSLKFSVWNSLVNGKSVNEWDRLARPPVTKTYQTPATPAPTSKALATPSGNSVARVAPTSCKQCGGMVAFLDGVSYCLACDWYEDDAEIAAGISEVCPFCYKSLDSEGKCEDVECGYSTARFIESMYFICKDHNTPLLFASSGENTYQYACPDCLIGNGQMLAAFLKEGMSHPGSKTVQIRQIRSKGEKSDDKKVAI